MGCGASSQPQFDPNSPVDLSHFKVERMLGEGGFGKVKYVIKKDTKVASAMKCMDKHIVTEKRQTQMVHKERSLLIDLSTVETGKDPCKFVTNMLYSFQDVHNAYLVIDLAVGGTLKFHLKDHPNGYPEARAQFYAAQICLGIAHLHANLILYRDCKPENVLLKENGFIMLSDFGVSEKLGNAEAQISGKVGTKSYMPPEALNGERYGLDFDWFSFGITLFELLTRNVPARLGAELQSIGNNTLSQTCKEYVTSLIDPDRASRLLTEEAVRNHAWFASIDFAALAANSCKAPFLPNPNKANFETHEDDILSALDDGATQKDTRPPLSEEEEAKFAGFRWSHDSFAFNKTVVAAAAE